MAYKIIELQQGSPEWRAHRALSNNASDAAAMLGVSPYMTRQQLLERRATGIVPDVDDFTQRLFDEGYAIEANARQFHEQSMGELYPITAVAVVNGVELSASMDGVNTDDTEGWECKKLNKELEAALPEGVIPEWRQVQLEQQAAVIGLQRTKFTGASLEDPEGYSVWYTPNPELRARIIEGWRIFERDLIKLREKIANGTAPKKTEKVVADPVESLPALSVQIEGKIVVHSTMKEWGDGLRKYIATIPVKPSTDADFANAEDAVKRLKEFEDRLASITDSALQSVEAVNELVTLRDTLHALSKATRTATDRLVKARKAELKGEIVAEAVAALAKVVDGYNVQLGKPYMPAVHTDFGGAIEGKRNFDSMRAAVDTLLVKAKLDAGEKFALIVANLTLLREKAASHKELFPDTAQLVLKATDDLDAVIAQRLQQHEQAEAKRKSDADALEATRQANAKADADRATAAAVSSFGTNARVPTSVDMGLAAAATQYETHGQPDTRQGVGAVVGGGMIPKRHSAEMVDDGRRMKMADIHLALCLPVTAAFIAKLGFHPLPKQGTSTVYRACDFPGICMALAKHFMDCATTFQGESK